MSSVRYIINLCRKLINGQYFENQKVHPLKKRLIVSKGYFVRIIVEKFTLVLCTITCINNCCWNVLGSRSINMNERNCIPTAIL